MRHFVIVLFLRKSISGLAAWAIFIVFNALNLSYLVSLYEDHIHLIAAKREPECGHVHPAFGTFDLSHRLQHSHRLNFWKNGNSVNRMRWPPSATCTIDLMTKTRDHIGRCPTSATFEGLLKGLRRQEMLHGAKRRILPSNNLSPFRAYQFIISGSLIPLQNPHSSSA